MYNLSRWGRGHRVPLCIFRLLGEGIDLKLGVVVVFEK